jgi:hypothetical protein
MARIRELTNSWAQNTWREQLSTIEIQDKIGERLLDVLGKFGLTEKNITGQSVTGLKRTAEDLFTKGLDISYSKAFDIAYSENPPKLPILFLRNVASKFDFAGAPQERFEGLVARGLRTFPSLLRDRDFGENLKRLFIEQGLSDSELDVVVNPEEDIPQHTDVLLRLRGQDYRIWLYQFTSRGLPHDIERVLGRRGELPNGVHVLCPLKTDVVMRKEKLENRLHWLTARLASVNLRYEKYKSKDCKGAIDCRETSDQLGVDIRQTQKELNEVSPSADSEIHTINGWYFYSEQKIRGLIRQVVDVSEKKTRPDSYSDVCRILVGPERYLGEIRFFSK